MSCVSNGGVCIVFERSSPHQVLCNLIGVLEDYHYSHTQPLCAMPERPAYLEVTERNKKKKIDVETANRTDSQT